eukprot:1144159-Pelagomonas_calceolata.AAC.5
MYRTTQIGDGCDMAERGDVVTAHGQAKRQTGPSQPKNYIYTGMYPPEAMQLAGWAFLIKLHAHENISSRERKSMLRWECAA